MKTHIFTWSIALASVLTLFLHSCQKNLLSLTDEEENRSFMAVFRQQANTGKSGDPLASQVVNTNDMYLVWNGINGAAGYRLKMKVQSGSWDIPTDILWDTIVGPDVLKLTKIDLQYSTKHNFAIQTLSPKGEAYHSKWYGLGDGAHNDDRAEWDMGERTGIPDVVSVSNVTETSMRVWFDLKVYNPDPAVLNPSFQHENDQFLLDEILVQPASVNRELESKSVKLTPTDLTNGYVDIGGLSSNALYVVNGLNNKVGRYWDRLYNTSMVRMRGQVGEPILIPHIVDNENTWAQQNNASRLDTILNNFLFDNTLAEGTIYMLEAGKKYYLGSNVVLAKGLTLRSTLPGTKPIVYMGLGYNETNNGSLAYNFQLGRPAQAGEIGSITVGDVIFDDISFELPLAVNFFNQSLHPGKAITGNYFINQHSASMPFTCSRLETRNCNFQGMVRSWFRTQGTNRQVIENIIVDNCLFHDAGMYDTNGRGYPLITGAAASVSTNIFNNVVIKNNSFIGISWDQLVRETANLAWAPSVVWNVTIENNTFLNAFSVSNGRFLIQHQNPPANSSYTVKKNLFISVKAANDDRQFFQSGMDFRTYRSGLKFDVADNYATASKSANGTVTYYSSAEIMNNQPFSHNSRGAGANGGSLNVGGLEATRVITGPTPIAPENLMVDPYPRGRKVGANWETNAHIYNINGLRYKNTPEVQNHPIYTKGIGDPRWR
ncbi:hypothetical protein FAZ15_13595 [Sphingobacterium olei]|uniref:Uncharacterized protein n=1 Tax=Sphingobacterium olei TaxID=2571155 RepID=A0A4U0NYX9_9SPHI|nr:hypothetical protein [Sphingobacterium olei]TJZ59920.1 hypothetical protein FAZ15_13595 [Sphingobacterium olei]